MYMNKIFLIAGATFSFNFGSHLTAIEGIVDGSPAAWLAGLRRPQIRTRQLLAYWQEDYVVGVITSGETLTLDKTILIYMY